MKYKHVDCPGRVLNNMQNAIEPRKGNWTAGKLEFIKNYKFTIAFENSDAIGYTTEKLIHPLLSNSIPIYYGNRNAAADGFNPQAFINGNDFESLDDLKKFVIELDQDDKRYMEMLRQPPLTVDSIPDWNKIIADYIMNILENGQKFTTHGQRLSPFYVLQHNSRKARKFFVKFLAIFVPNKSKRMQLRQRFGVWDIKKPSNWTVFIILLPQRLEQQKQFFCYPNLFWTAQCLQLLKTMCGLYPYQRSSQGGRLYHADE